MTSRRQDGASYFAGLTYHGRRPEQVGGGDAEERCRIVNGDVAALAKLALAQLYRQTGRDADAATLYQELAKGGCEHCAAGHGADQAGRDV